jgi:hypothetical protein
MNGIEIAVAEKKPSLILTKQEKKQGSIEKSAENLPYEAQGSNKKSEAHDSKAQISNSSLANIKKEYVEEAVLENNNNNQSNEKKTNSVKIIQQQSTGNKMTSKPFIEENGKNRDEKKKNSQITNDNNFHMVVGPEIFVSLKKGSISTQYDIGKTLGEGDFPYIFKMNFMMF